MMASQRSDLSHRRERDHARGRARRRQRRDEGKGKATDLMGGEVDYVVRYKGGYLLVEDAVTSPRSCNASPTDGAS